MNFIIFMLAYIVFATTVAGLLRLATNKSWPDCLVLSNVISVAGALLCMSLAAMRYSVQLNLP